MTFNSVEFFVFFVVTYLLYRILPFRAQNIMLLVASYIFYGWWDVHLLFLIVLSTVIDFACGAMIATGRLSRLNRYYASFSVILAAFLFTAFQWNAIQISTKPITISIKWLELFTSSFITWLNTNHIMATAL